RRVDVPAFDITDRVELAGMSGTPEGDRWALIEHPAHRKCQYRFAKALSRQLLEFADRSEILAEALILEFRVDFAEIIAVELGFQGHPSAQETTTERSVAQDRQSSADSVRQHIRLDGTLKEVVWRLHGVELGVSAEHTHLGWRKIADADRPNLTLAAQVFHRPRGLCNRGLKVRPMHLIEIDDISAQPSQRILDFLADASGAGITIDGT